MHSQQISFALLAVLVVAAVGLRTPDSRQTEER
ncbi:hypothetical protein J2X28_000117 [Kocuria rhizophila]|nr:hypothetical protein [Kocuria rhizophila]